MAEGVPVAAPTENKKRRRDVDDHSGPASHSDRSSIPRIPQPPPPQTGNDKPINYLCKPDAPRLRLFQSENGAFSHILGLINDYEGVLSRHESLAAKLGAKLTSPRLLRAMESLFEGSIAATPLCQYGDARASDPTWCAPSWLEIVDFAASHPRDFNLTSTPDGRRVCNFTMNNVHVEISEDDWRLIMSGALDRFRLVPPEPIEEDEVAELATIDILEKRLQTLIKEADEVARKARRLNYHLSGRKAALNSRRSSTTQSIPTSSRYQPVSQQRPPPPGSLNPAYDLQADLLQQFLAPSILPQSGSSMTQPASVSSGSLPIDVPRQSTAPSTITTSQIHILTPNSRRSPAYSAGSPTRREGTAPTSTAEESQAPYRSIVQTHVEELTKGDRITPPCDRCRRLNVICVKNLTSCQGCTKKHAKCTWKSVTDDEIDVLRGREPALAGDRSERGDAGSREGPDGESEGLYETNEAATTAAADTSLPTTEGDVDTEAETPEAVKLKDTPPSSASSSTRGQQPQQQARSISTGRHRHQ